MANELEPLRIGALTSEGVGANEVRSPFDGRLVGRCAQAGAEHMDSALELAQRARPIAAATSTALRANVLERVARGLREDAEALAVRIALEVGKPLALARAEVERAALTFELAASAARTYCVATPPVDLDPRGVGRVAWTQRVPRGVVAAITPFNFPLNLAAHKLAPAVAAGAPFVLKPAPQAPLTGLDLVRRIVEAGWPAEAAFGLPCAPVVAQRLAEDRRVAVLSFTGSDAVGWKLAALAARKRVVLELGGAAPCIVDETVDLAPLAPLLVASAFAYAGQVCIKTQRVLVQRSRFAELLELLAAGARAVRCGDPLDPATSVGPLIDERSLERVQAWIDEARRGGARLVCGGEREGNVVRPALLTDVPDGARISCDEVFGPVLNVEPFERFEDALARANATRFGLQAGVFTRDLARALAAQRELEFGAVIVNDTPTLRLDALAYGGTKDSGLGREGPAYALEEYTEPRLCVLRAAP